MVDPAKFERKIKKIAEQLNLKYTNDRQSPRSGAVYNGYLDQNGVK